MVNNQNAILVLPTDQPDLVLRQLATSEDDAALAAAINENPDYASQFGNTLVTNLGTEEKAAAARQKAGDAIRMGIWQDDVLVGLISATPKRANQEAEIGYFVRESASGNGIAKLALRSLAGYVRPRFGRVYADVHPKNQASAKVLQGSGFAKTARRKRPWGTADVYEPVRNN